MWGDPLPSGTWARRGSGIRERSARFYDQMLEPWQMSWLQRFLHPHLRSHLHKRSENENFQVGTPQDPAPLRQPTPALLLQILFDNTTLLHRRTPAAADAASAQGCSGMGAHGPGVSGGACVAERDLHMSSNRPLGVSGRRIEKCTIKKKRAYMFGPSS